MVHPIVPFGIHFPLFRRKPACPREPLNSQFEVSECKVRRRCFRRFLVELEFFTGSYYPVLSYPMVP